MKPLCYLLYTIFLLSILLNSKQTSAQCTGTYTAAQINWDYLDYLIYTGNYNGYVTQANARSQFFAIGPNRLNIVVSADIDLVGENATHTGNLTNYSGQDVEFEPNSNAESVTLTFETEVMNASFTLYDLDGGGVYTVNAVNAGGTAQTVNTSNTGGTLTVTGAPGKTITAAVANLANNLNTGAVTFTVTAPVKTITIGITTRGTNDEFWLSDIRACVQGSFPDLTYHMAARPFIGMPAYTVIVADSVFMLLDPATGYAKELFNDPGNGSMNSLGYDAINRHVYYTWNRSGTNGALNPNQKALYRYSLDTETITQVSADVTIAPLNIPTFDVGVESGGASFYNGSFYMGIEGPDNDRNSARENIIWKVDFNPTTFAATRATQIYAARADSNVGGNDRLIHDWGDFGASNGFIYDFDATSSTAFRDSMYYHYNLMTGERQAFLPTDAIKPSQTCIDYLGKLYNMWGTVPGQAAQAIIAPYNMNGTLDLANQHNVYTIVNNVVVFPVVNWADAGEAIRPNCDFGDAPASYDPNPWSPAVHEKDTAIRIGATFDREPAKVPSALANGDGTDEDGLTFVPIFSSLYHYYLTPVRVYNNTGLPATLMAWLDYNGNGTFDASEAIAPIVVNSSPVMQTRALYWSGITSAVPNGGFTYLRVRFVRGTGTMTAANATGYYGNGETEDYRVLVDNVTLSANMLDFDAKAINNSSVQLTWNTSDEKNLDGFQLQRSADNADWTTIDIIAAKGNDQAGVNNYTYTDIKPLAGRSYYKMRLLSGDARQKYSETRMVVLKGIEEFHLSPNPAVTKATAYIHSLVNTTGRLRITNINGQTVIDQLQQIRKGANSIDLPSPGQMPAGIYVVQLSANGEVFIKKLIITR